MQINFGRFAAELRLEKGDLAALCFLSILPLRGMRFRDGSQENENLRGLFAA